MIDIGKLTPLSRVKLPKLAGYDSKASGWYYSQKLADRAVEFFPAMLTHVKSSRFTRAREPFKLQPWQELATRLMFGVVNKEGLRRYRNCYIEVPRKNGKTTWAAGLALYGLFCDGEQGAECYCAAASRDQARLLFDVCHGMIRQNKKLKTNCKVRETYSRIIYQSSFLKAIPADAHTAHGFNSHFIVCDELHSWKGRDLYDVLKTSTGARAQSLMVAITTAGYDRNSICWELHEYARRVRDGDIDDQSFLPILYYAEESDDWKSEKTWKKANPNYGVSLAPEYMKQQAKEAEANPAYQNSFRRLHLDQWTSQQTRWINMDQWRACRATDHDFDRDKPVFGGLDLSTTTDITSWCMLQPTGEGYVARWRCFIPQDRADRAEQVDGVPYRQWINEGWVTATPGARVDYEYIYQAILDDAEEWGISFIGFDPWNAEYMQQRLSDEGLSMVKVRQGYQSLSEPCKHLEAAIATGKFDHGNNPVATTHADNIEVKEDPNRNIRPVKPEHSNKRIDCIVAAIIALATALAASEEQQEAFDFYETHELEMF